jgi:uncharacterized protein
MIFPGALKLEIQNEELWLLPGRAVYWPAGNTLLIADMHIGKAAAFRARHVPIPDGSMQEDFDRLSGLLHLTGATTLAVLGDWIHSALGCTPAVLAAAHAWRTRHPQLHIDWIRGNHDKAPAELLAQFDFVLHDQQLRGPFCFQHEPAEHPTHFTFAGHLHPKHSIGGRGYPRTSLPCFHFTPRLAVLPAFGSFTGGHFIDPKPTSRIFLLAGTDIIEWQL